jgi:hypothetical protein
MLPVRPPPDADAGGLPALELAWLGAGGAVAPLVPPLSPLPPGASPLRCLPEVLWLLVMLLLYSSLLPLALCNARCWSLVLVGDALLVVLRLAFAKFS